MPYPTPAQIDHGVIPMVLDMAAHGLKADREHFRNLDVQFGIEMAKLESAICGYAGGYINVGSHQQVSKMLYQTLKIPKPKIKSKKSGSTMTANEILSQLVGVHPVIQLIRKHRMFAKLRNTYTGPMYKRFIRSNGRVYPIFRITSTETGRLSSASPNVMAVPTRTKEGSMIRCGYVPSPGNVMLSIDFSGIEMRVMAWQAGDSRMIGIFKSGGDIHNQTASWLFEKPIDHIHPKKERVPSKTVGFGVAYGISAQGMQRNLFGIEGCEDWDEQKCQRAIDRWFELYPDIALYMADIARFAMRHGYVSDFVGRRRLVPGAQLKDDKLRARAIRQAGNHPIQAGAQELIKMAMDKIQPVIVSYRNMGYFCAPLAQVHDEILTEVDENIVHAFAAECQGIMENIAVVSTGLKTDAEVSDKSWGELVPLWDTAGRVEDTVEEAYEVEDEEEIDELEERRKAA